MKVIIELSSEQAAALKAEIDRNNAGVESANDWESLKLGDVLVISHGWLNTNQSLTMDGRKVIFEGERCALRSDGLFELLAKAVSPKAKELFDAPWDYETNHTSRKAAWEYAHEAFSKLRIVEYHTSDKRLKWWENFKVIASKFDASELAQLSGEQLWSNSLADNPTVKMLRGLLDKLRFANINYRQVSAQLDSLELTVFNKMRIYAKYRFH